MAKKHYAAKRTDRLWGAVRLWAWLFMLGAAAMAATFAYRAWSLSRLGGGYYITELDVIPGAETEVWTSLAALVLYLITYATSVILVLMWYLRSVRNAHAMSRGMETSPGWTIWFFILPIVSLWKPYSITSELWRSSAEPDRWRGLGDPALLRWWWGAVLAGSFTLVVADIISRTAQDAAQLGVAGGVQAGGHILQIIAGILFLRIGMPISTRQSALVAEGRTQPPRDGFAD